MTVESIFTAAYMLIQALSPTIEQASLDKRELFCLSENIFHEARGESLLGQAAVAWVTKNRVESKRWPDTYCEVVWQPKQFSWTLVEPSIELKNKIDIESWVNAIEVAALVQSGLLDSPVDKATHYLALHKLKRKPKWAKMFKKVAQLDGHTFYLH